MKSPRLQCISRAREEGCGWMGGMLFFRRITQDYIYIFIESQVKKVKNSKPENAVICHML